jgi:ectoine hydroxylase-related dioxygenase (phytanoyl-CoA dioxygenase family)
VHYLRYSHKKTYPPIFPIPDIDFESADVFAAELDSGDVVIHNALTVHWSGVNQTGLARRAVSYFYSRSDTEAEVPVSANVSGHA